MLWKFFCSFVNALIKGLGYALKAISLVLPDSPFSVIDNSPIHKYLGYINYFFPVGEIIVILETWLICVGIYYIYRIALRWIKAQG